MLLFSNLLYPSESKEQGIFTIDDLTEGKTDISSYLKILTEDRIKYDIEEIIAGEESLFINDRSNLSRTEDSRIVDFWARIKFRSEFSNETEWILKLPRNYSSVTAYIASQNGKIDIQKSGWSLSPSERTINDPEVIFNFLVPAKQNLSVYLHVKTDLRWSSIDRIQTNLYSEPYWNQTKLKNYNFLSVYAGICLLALFYWLITYIYSRRLNYIYLIAATLSALIFCLDVYGVLGAICSERPFYWFAQFGKTTLWLPLVVISHFVLSFKANPFKSNFSKPVIFGYWFACFFTVAVLITSPFILEWKNGEKLSLSFVFGCMALGVILINYLLFKKGFKASVFGFFAILPIFLGVSVYIFSSLGFIGEQFNILLPIGALCTVIMFFYGMVVYVRVLRYKRKLESLKKERLIIGQNILLEKKVEERTAELKLANEEISSTLEQLKETQEQLVKAEKIKENAIIRSRISQDIHDDISSELSRISWVSELAKSNAMKGNITEVPTLLDKVSASSRETISKLGEIIWAINPNYDNLDGLLSYMRNYVAKFLEHLPIQYSINFPIDNIDISINPELKRNLFLVLKESLNNAVKYAQASQIQISFTINGDEYELKIVDDGIGITEGVIHGSGNGLANMHKRMERIGGRCEIISEEGNGATLVFKGKIF